MKRVIIPIVILLLLVGAIAYAEQLHSVTKNGETKVEIVSASGGLDSTTIFTINLHTYGCNKIIAAVSNEVTGDSTAKVAYHWSVDSTTWTALAEVDSSVGGATLNSVSSIYGLDSIAKYLRCKLYVGDSTGDTSVSTATWTTVMWYDD